MNALDSPFFFLCSLGGREELSDSSLLLLSLGGVFFFHSDLS